jgi:hypothetical protein
MTKEKILEDGTNDYCSPLYAAELYKNGEIPIDAVERSVGSAMDEYAKIVAIEFAMYAMGVDPNDPEMGGVSAFEETYNTFLKSKQP